MCSSFYTLLVVQSTINTTLHKVSASLLYSCILQYLHPFLVREYREAIRITRRVGRECIMRRIDAIDNGESVPNDILTASILKTAGELIQL